MEKFGSLLMNFHELVRRRSVKIKKTSVLVNAGSVERDYLYRGWWGQGGEEKNLAKTHNGGRGN